MSLPENSSDLPKSGSAGSDKESMDRFTDPPESSDCSNHSTTDKDSEEVSDSDTRRGEAAAMPQPSVRARHYVQPPTSSAGVLAPSRLGNPFARVASPVVRSSADSSETRAGAAGGGGGLLAPSRLGGGGGRAVLRPSALSVPAASLKTPETNGLASSTFTLHPPKFNNPFAAKPAPEEDSDTSPEGASTEALSATSTAAGQETVTSTSGSNGFSLSSAAAAATNAATKPEEAEATSSSAAFVFGQNLEDRVANAAPNSTAPDAAGVSSTAEEAPPPAEADVPAADDSAAAAAAAPAADAAGEAVEGVTPPSVGLSLRESAEVYEKQRAAKRKYEQVEVVTGEEDESNVLQINCKLYAFDKETCWWQERGRGLLRLNDRRQDSGPLHSRLVFRTQGSLRLVLNTKIWPGMSVEKPSDKDVRVTAVDNDQVKVFLIKCSTKDAELLFNALHCRLSSLKADPTAAETDVPPPDTNGDTGANDAKRAREPQQPPAQG